MNITSISNPRYADQAGTLIDVDVEFDTLPGIHGYTAKINDTNEKSRLIYDQAVAGAFGAIATYVAPVQTQAQINAAADAAIRAVFNTPGNIATILGVLESLAIGPDKAAVKAINDAVKAEKLKRA